MKLIEKLGITPPPWECKNGWWVGVGSRCLASCQENDGLVIAASPEMIEILYKLITSKTGRLDEYYTLCGQAIETIEKATGKTWEEIKKMMEDG